MAQQALTLAQGLGDRRREMRSLSAMARQCIWLSDPKGLEFAERALDLARQLLDTIIFLQNPNPMKFTTISIIQQGDRV